jgi:hypothetical protein
MNYEAYRITHQSAEGAAKAAYIELRATFNALLHARDALWLVDEQGLWDHMNVDDVAEISDTMDKVEAFCAKRTGETE